MMSDLHITIDDKSVINTCQTLRDYFSHVNNPIIIIGNKYGYDYSSFDYLLQIKKSINGYCSLYNYMKKAERIHLHGLFDIPTMIILALYPSIAAKSNWIMWGHDLYSLIDKPKDIVWRIIGVVRKKATKNIRYITTNVEGDYQLLENIMKKKYEFFKVRFSPNSIANVYQMNPKEHGDTINILLGNSATETNCHMEALELLSKYSNNDIQIYAPLSYGDSKYRDKVIEYGKKLFGDKFSPICDFMTHNEYYMFLSTIDVAVFAHNRQQAMGNIVPLLFAGKKVFMKSNISSWSCLVKDYNIQLFDYFSIAGSSFDEFARNTIDVTFQQEKIKDMADKGKFIDSYKKMLISEG